MSVESILTFAVIALYSAASLAAFLGTLSARRPVKVAANWLTLAGFALHTVLCIISPLGKSYEELSAGYFVRLFAWCVILAYLFAWKLLHLPFLSITAAPLALLLFFLSAGLGNVRDVLPPHLAGLFIWLHLSSLFLSMGLMAMAFGAGVFFLYLEAKIKGKAPLSEATRDMPALSTCDRVNRVAVTIGFPLFTLGIMSGFIWTPLLFSTVETPKVLSSLVIWFLYAFLFYQRMALGRQGRKTALLAVVLFSLAALFFGADYLFFPHHGQTLQSAP